MIGPKTKVSILSPEGKPIQEDAMLIPVVRNEENWSEATLEDGTVIRFKQTLIKVYRVDGKYDGDGNPQYIINAAPIISVESPPELKKKE